MRKMIKVRLTKPTYSFIGAHNIGAEFEAIQYEGVHDPCVVDASVFQLRAAGIDDDCMDDGDGLWPFVIGFDVEVVE